MALRGASASTQNHAFSALVLFYRIALKQELGKVNALRAKRPTVCAIVPTVPRPFNCWRTLVIPISTCEESIRRLQFILGLTLYVTYMFTQFQSLRILSER